MFKEKTVGVVVVAYNEEGLVGQVIDTLPEFVDRAYVVDDGSTDDTWNEVQTHARRLNERGRSPDDSETRVGDEDGEVTAAGYETKRRPPESGDDGDHRRLQGDGGVEPLVVPIRHETNTGVGGALKTGYRRAYEDEMDVTVVMAGDGQMDPEECHRIVKPVAEGRADYAKANRLLDAELREDMPTWRLFGNSVLTVLTKIASGYWQMMDPANGYTAISHEALETIDLDAIYEDYGAAHDILIRLNVENCRIADVPMPASYGDEESSIRYSTFVPNLSMLLLRGFLWRLKTKYVVRNCHPFVLFYGLGVLGGTIALLEWLGTALDSESTRTQTLLASGLFILSGALITFGMVFDLLDNQDLEFRTEE